MDWHGHGSGALLQPVASPNLPLAISVTLWNYMGWDNACTIAQEVDNPQRNYPRAMVGAAALVASDLPAPAGRGGPCRAGPGAVLYRSLDGCCPMLAGPVLAVSVVLGGMINGAGMFNPLMMSYPASPYAVAADGLLPRIFTRLNARRVPVVSLLFCAIIWALALNFTFERLISIDLVLYGASLLLEFVALVVLRRREPHLDRPFRVPGGMAGAVLTGVGPALLIAFALYAARNEHVFGLNALVFSAAVALAGGLVYGVQTSIRVRVPAGDA